MYEHLDPVELIGHIQHSRVVLDRSIDYLQRRNSFQESEGVPDAKVVVEILPSPKYWNKVPESFLANRFALTYLSRQAYNPSRETHWLI